MATSHFSIPFTPVYPTAMRAAPNPIAGLPRINIDADLFLERPDAAQAADI